MASMGGLMQLFYIVFSIVNIPFSEISKYEPTITKIFYFDNPDLSII